MSKPKADRNIQEVPDSILKQLLTTSEIRMLKNRWQIIKYLQEGMSIRMVAEKVKVGTDTVVRVSKMMKTNNLGKKINKEKKIGNFKTNTPWIFGKK